VAHTSDVAQLRSLVMDLQFPAIETSSKEALAMAGGLTVDHVNHFQVYDAFSVNVPISLEAAGFCKQGEGFEYIQDGRIGIGGELPCNTSGGMLSESYMHGWNHSVELVRQLRHEAGARQVTDAETSMYVRLSSEEAECTVFRRGS
jgi:acetyl-CoA acetyltransferase